MKGNWIPWEKCYNAIYTCTFRKVGMFSERFGLCVNGFELLSKITSESHKIVDEFVDTRISELSPFCASNCEYAKKLWLKCNAMLSTFFLSAWKRAFACYQTLEVCAHMHAQDNPYVSSQSNRLERSRSMLSMKRKKNACLVNETQANKKPLRNKRRVNVDRSIKSKWEMKNGTICEW